MRHSGYRLLSPVASWYETNKRYLPWRGAGAWGVLVSEVMLQQTPVARVLPAYLAWTARWPSPASLAAAAPAEVLTAWGRLGYPRRALNLHRASVVIVDHHGGSVPDDLHALTSLPGIGEYTARAVSVFGFGRRHGVVDVNVRRVLARCLDGVSETPPRRGDIDRLESLLPADPASAGHLSAGLMELGALVCRKRNPACRSCPLARSCRWLQAGLPPGPPLGRQAPYEGSDRQARGSLLAVLRSGLPLDASAARRAVPDIDRRRRALAGLAADGLIERNGRLWRFPTSSS